MPADPTPFERTCPTGGDQQFNLVGLGISRLKGTLGIDRVGWVHGFEHGPDRIAGGIGWGCCRQHQTERVPKRRLRYMRPISMSAVLALSLPLACTVPLFIQGGGGFGARTKTFSVAPAVDDLVEILTTVYRFPV